MITRALPHIVAVFTLIAFATSGAGAQGDSAYFRDVLYLGREYINDHALVEADGVWHLFYTRGDMSIRPWMSQGNEVAIGHATSRDLLDWQPLPPVLSIGPKGSFDAEHVYAPAVIRDGDRWLMLYTGNARGFFSGEQILAATSSDLMTWTKLDRPPAPVPDSSWAAFYPPGYDSGAGGPVSCRDPFLLRLDDGGYVCYYVVRLRDTAGIPARACIAAATSDDLVTWTQRGIVLTRPVSGDDVNPYTHPESPCVVVRNGLYHLFWKGGSGTRWIASDDPFDFEGGEEKLISTSHASKVIEWRGEWLITSCSRAVNDVMHTQSDRTRGLYLAGLAWDGDRPRVTALPAVMSIENERMPAPAMHPNPAHRGVPVRFDGGEGEPEILDLLGRAHRVGIETAGRALLVQTEELAPGIYIVRRGGRSERLVIVP
jgi:hypothetical protein